MTVSWNLCSCSERILSLEQWSWAQPKPFSSICLGMSLLGSQYRSESSISSTRGNLLFIATLHGVYTEMILDHVGSGNAWQKLQESSSMCRYSLPLVLKAKRLIEQ